MTESGIRSAIYARKSTEQTGVADEAKSVTRQVARARQYAEKQGWTVSEDHIYVDDAVSGAEFEKRPDLQKMMASLDPKPRFQRLIMMEISRLGRESIETSYVLKQIVQAGVRVFCYLDDEEKVLDSAMDKVVMSLATFSDEVEREKTRQRVYDSAKKRAEEGWVTAGRCFGYSNRVVELPMGADGSVHRSHVERVINPDHAKVVRQIFELYAQGYGMTKIAKRLNGEKALCPKPQRGRKPAWASGTVRQVLDRSDYRGVSIWNKTRSKDKWGKARRTHRPESEWVITPMEELRIVPAELVAKVDARRKDVRSRQLRLGNGTLLGRPPAEGTKHLLVGLARCVCGASMEARKVNWGEKKVVVYSCRSYSRKGKSVCSNGMRIQAPVLENAILRQIEAVMLDADLIHEAIDQAVAKIEGDGGKAKELELQSEIKRLKMEISRFIEAIAQGTDSKTLSTELRNREVLLEEAEGDLEALHLDQSTAWRKDGKVRQALESRIKDWTSLLRRHTPQASQILKKLVDGSITLTPKHVDGVRFYSFEGVGTVTGLLSGVIPQKLPSLNKTRPLF